MLASTLASSMASPVGSTAIDMRDTVNLEFYDNMITKLCTMLTDCQRSKDDMRELVNVKTALLVTKDEYIARLQPAQ